MSHTLVIPRKDARLAATVMLPALVVILAALLLALFGDVIPGAARILWPGTSVSTLADRLARIEWLLAGACFVVPCWASVAIALGDRSRRAQYLATLVPAVDGAKAFSKVLVALGCALVVWALFCVVAGVVAVPPGRSGVPSQWLLALQVLAISTGGAACGLGAANLVRRVPSAGMLAMMIPVIGLPVGQLFTRWFVRLPSPTYLTSEEWSRLVNGQNELQPYVAAGAALGFAIALAACAVPMLAGRDTRPRVVRALLAAALVAVAVAGVSTAGLASEWTAFGRRLTSLHRAVVERTSWSAATDAELINAVTDQFVPRRPPNEALVVALAAGWPRELLQPLYGEGTYGGEFNGRPPEAYDAARFELERRRKNSPKRLDDATRALVESDGASVERRLAVIELSSSNYVANLARLLVLASEELDRARVIVELARWSGEDLVSDGQNLPRWCKVLECARSTLEAIPYDPKAPSAASVLMDREGVRGDEAVPIEQAIALLSAPMPELAERAASASPPATREELECIRKGLTGKSQRP